MRASWIISSTSSSRNCALVLQNNEILYSSEVDKSKCRQYSDKDGQAISALLLQVVDKWNVAENGFNNAFVKCYIKWDPIGFPVIMPSNEINETVPKVESYKADCDTYEVGLYFLM